MQNTIEIFKTDELTGHNGAIYSLLKAPGTGKFYSGGGDGKVVEWDLANPQTAKVIAQIDSRVFSMALLKTQKLLLVGNMEGGLHWIDLEKKVPVAGIAHHKDGIFDIWQIDDAVLTFGGDGKLTKWSIDSRLPQETLHLSGYSLRGADRLKGTDLIAIGASDNAIYLVDFVNMRLVDRIDEAHDNSVFTVKYVLDGIQLVSGGRDAHLKVWNVEEHYKNTVSHPAHWFTVNHLEIIPEKNLIASASRDKTIKLWDLDSFELMKVIDLAKNKAHINSVNRLLWMPDEQKLISGSDDRKIMVWDIKRLSK